ncbi:hypothetical protein GCM10010342_77590 [Streptomyces anulatus]|nr:hypothetical protein GCM10010342_77590 [Streptomyces anulatus]
MAGMRKTNPAGSTNSYRSDVLRVLGALKVATATAARSPPTIRHRLPMASAEPPRKYLPQEIGFGSGMPRWRRLAEWTEAEVWPRLHEALLARLRSTNALDFSRAAVDGSHIRALKGAPRRDEALLTGAGRAASIT